MYTQCPECLTAFRVTAGLLQQASGRVRCGSCGHAFSAVEHLSEDLPPADDAADNAPAGSDETQDALLDTFTDLSGFDDIRIEDTGVEWRVVDEEDTDAPSGGDEPGDVESGSLRWFLANEDEEEPPGPAVPEVRDEVPADARLAAEGDDTGIHVEESGLSEMTEAPPADSLSNPAAHDPQETLDLPRTDAAEPRYDDNTPLPDDFDAGTADETEPEPPRRRATDHIEPRPPEFDERQADLVLGAPEDWRELLEEFGAAGNARAMPAPPAGSPDEPDEPYSESSADIPSDIDTQFDLKALEMGIDVSGSRPALAGDETEDETVDPGFSTGEGEHGVSAADLELAADTGGHPAAADLQLESDADTDTDIDIDDEPGTVDIAPATRSQAVEFEAHADDEAAPDIDLDRGEERADDEPDFGFSEAFDTAATRQEEEAREAREREAALDAELDAAYAPEELPTPSSPEDGEPDAEVPPQTEEELTINLQIEQDLMRLAAEEGFTATVPGERRVPEDSPLVETIILEGDFVRSALDKELDEVIETVGGVDDDPRLLLDTYIKSTEPIRGGRRRSDPPSYAVIAGVVALAVLLTAQVVHAYRETLATYGSFNRTVGSVYRLFGAPLVPAWDVRGWRFEATSGSTDQADDVLTIRSRISNRSGGDLPYPLLHVALTDRFEEVIGSRILEPADYLAEDDDTASLVSAGEEFSATITVQSLSADATGFKLNLCYREGPTRLRCATGDFRN